MPEPNPQAPIAVSVSLIAIDIDGRENKAGV